MYYRNASPPQREMTHSERRISMSIRSLLLDAGLPSKLITKKMLAELLELYVDCIGPRAVVVGDKARGRVIIPRRLE